MKRFVAISCGCAVALFVSSAMWSIQQIYAQDKSVEEELHVHRLKSGETSAYDAFAYLNRVSNAPVEGETPVQYAGNVIFSRLANTEGRIQLKVVKGFQMPEYLGYKSFLRAWEETEGTAVGACVVCHTPAKFEGKASDGTAAPSLRNLNKSNEELKKIVQQKVELAKKARGGDTKIDEAYKLLLLSDKDVDNMVAFLQTLNKLPPDEFRQIIVDAVILDTSKMETL